MKEALVPACAQIKINTKRVDELERTVSWHSISIKGVFTMLALAILGVVVAFFTHVGIPVPVDFPIK
jgi:hypothetical protein